MILILVSIIFIVVIALAFPIIKIFHSSSVFREPPAAHLPVLTHNLYRHVEVLSSEIGSRSFKEHEKLTQAQKYIEGFLKDLDITYSLQSYPVEGKLYNNIIVTLPGINNPPQTVVIGAHYDTVANTPGADDNASGVAVLLEMCRMLKGHVPGKTIKMVFFTLEEPPVFNTEEMGSWMFAKEAKDCGENISLMISLDMVGYYSNKAKGQQFPLPFMNLFYPTKPDFILIAGDTLSQCEIKLTCDALKEVCDFRVESLTVQRYFPGVRLSDNSSFWKMGFKAMMITDTALYRNPNYHNPQDTIDTLDFDKMTDLCEGLAKTIKKISR